MPNPPQLPAGVTVFERGWLSANNVWLHHPDGCAVVDTGYGLHAEQTLALVQQARGDAPLTHIVNTHLHSDHCGGNRLLQHHHVGVYTWVPQASFDAVTRWDDARLTYRATGQACERFGCTHALVPGQTVVLGGHTWHIHAGPGHDPDAVLLFEPHSRTLISGDALWGNGFGVVFPELDGEPGFDDVGRTLDLIEALSPTTVIPGHGPVFGGDEVAQALGRARSRLAQFMSQPAQHIAYGVKVLLKFRLLHWQRVPWPEVLVWGRQTPHVAQLHAQHGGDAPLDAWLTQWAEQLVQAGAAAWAHTDDGLVWVNA